MIPNEQSFCEIDPTVVDRWGIPVLRFHFKWSDNEVKMVKHMEDSFAAILEGMGGRVNRSPAPPGDKISVPGAIIHELGTVRMGKDPKTSVLNKFNQVHACKNVFVTDGSFMASSACQNPSLTYMAFTARAADHAVNELKKGNL